MELHCRRSIIRRFNLFPDWIKFRVVEERIAEGLRQEADAAARAAAAAATQEGIGDAANTEITQTDELVHSQREQPDAARVIPPASAVALQPGSTPQPHERSMDTLRSAEFGRNIEKKKKDQTCTDEV